MLGTLLFTTLFVALCCLKRRPQPVLELVYDSLPRDLWDETNASPDWFYLACEYPQATVEASQTSDANFDALMSLADDTVAEDSSSDTAIRTKYLSDYSLVELRDLAKDLKVKGWSRMRKAELVSELVKVNRLP